MLKINNLTKKIGTQDILEGIDLNIPSGSVYGLLGPNGAGKSTTMKIILSLMTKSSGNIEFLGHKMDPKKDLINIGALIEEPAYYSNLSGYENLLLMQQMGCLPIQNIEKVLSIVNLYKDKDKLVKNYSLGMKQRLGIAMALIKFPKFLILDEPTNGLDPEGMKEIRELIKKLPEEYGTTVLVSSHLLGEIELMCDYVGIINHGTTIFESKIDEIPLKKNLVFKVSDIRGAKKIIQDDFNLCVEIDKKNLICEMPDDKHTISNIIYCLCDHEINIYEVSPHIETLENFFLKKINGDGEKNDKKH